ncbi:ubiquitin-conjugating enzyme E2Q-like protein 1 isoform X1 [Haliaeetus albicilla]|uniref:ubiquitin-conjugating enzyme E2Q-like protein 1 isoform X1 n=1 Tax=Haliaeetus albicilla TaxID=8969 RepID=UPI0037E7E500
MATLLRKIGLIRLHNRDTEDPKHHHHHHHHRSSSSQQGSSLRGRGNQKNSSNKPQPQGPPGGGGGGCSSSSSESSPGGHKNKKAPELAKQPPQPRSGGGREKPREAAREPGVGKEAAQRPGPGPGPGPGCGSGPAPLVPLPSGSGPLAPAGRQQHCTQVRTRRLMKELQDIARLSDRFISVELVDESLFDWNVKLHQVDKDSVLWQDMKETNTEYILLNLTFPDNFPFSPPFMRVLSPRLENGYVLDGGAICMELLTPRGWSSAYTVEAVMRQFAASLVKGQGRICRKAGKSKKSFSRKEAEATFKSLVKTHEKYGWVTPPVSDG